MTLRLGELCAGYGGLGMAVSSVLDAELAWCAQYEPPDKNGKPDKNQYAAQIMAARFPGVPNHGDITAIDYSQVEPVDILTAGFPCQPVSNAGLRKGQEDARWIWPAVAAAVRVLRPRVVLLENVAALVGRGLDAVLGDLASLGFDAEWTTLPASAVGAPHERERIFILAWPAADAPCDGRHEGRPEPARLVGRPDAAERGGPPPADTGRDTRTQDDQNRPTAGRCGGTPAHSPRLAEREPADRAHPITGSRNTRPEPRGRSLPDRERESDPVIRLLPTPTVSDTNGPGRRGAGGQDLRTAISQLTGARTPPQSATGKH